MPGLRDMVDNPLMVFGKLYLPQHRKDYQPHDEQPRHYLLVQIILAIARCYNSRARAEHFGPLLEQWLGRYVHMSCTYPVESVLIDGGF